MDISFITRITFTGELGVSIDQLRVDNTPNDALQHGLVNTIVNALAQLKSSLRALQPKKKNVWVPKHMFGTLEMRHDCKEGSPIYTNLSSLIDYLLEANALVNSSISRIEVYKVSPNTPNSAPRPSPPIFSVDRGLTALSKGYTNPMRVSLSSRPCDATPLSASLNSHPSPAAIPRPHGLPPKPGSAHHTASIAGKTSIIGGDVPISTVRAGRPATAAGVGALPTNPISLGIQPHKQSEASSSKTFGGSAPTEVAPAMRRRSSSSMSISTSGSATPVLASAQLPLSHLQAGKSTTKPSGVGKVPAGDIYGMAGMTPTHGKQVLDPFAFPAIGSAAAATSTTPLVSAVAKTPLHAHGLSAFGPPPIAVSAFPQSASGQPRQKMKLLGGTSAQGSRGSGPSSNQTKRQAAKSASRTSEADELAKSKQLLFDLLKTLDLERTEHAEELEAAKKRHADELEAASTKHGRDLAAANIVHAQEVAEVRAQWAEDVRVITSQQLKTDDEAKKAVEGVKEVHEQEMAGLKAKWAEDFRASVDRRLEVEKVASETEEQLKRAKDVHAREVAEVKAQWAEDVRAYEARQLEAQIVLREVKDDMKQQVANTFKEAEMEATKLLEMQKRQSAEEVQRIGRELELARRDAEMRKQEVVGMKRKRAEMTGRLVRMRGEDVASPRTAREEDEADITGTVASLESYIQGMRMTLQSEISSRQVAEHELRVLRDVDRERKEPFVVPALLEAFVKLARLGDGLAEDSR